MDQENSSTTVTEETPTINNRENENKEFYKQQEQYEESKRFYMLGLQENKIPDKTENKIVFRNNRLKTFLKRKAENTNNNNVIEENNNEINQNKQNQEIPIPLQQQNLSTILNSNMQKIETNEIKEYNEMKEMREMKELKQRQQIKELKQLKPSKEIFEIKENKDKDDKRINFLSSNDHDETYKLNEIQQNDEIASHQDLLNIINSFFDKRLPMKQNENNTSKQLNDSNNNESKEIPKQFSPKLLSAEFINDNDEEETTNNRNPQRFNQINIQQHQRLLPNRLDRPNIFIQFRQQLKQFGLSFQSWPEEIKLQYGTITLHHQFQNAMTDPQQFANCPNDIKFRIFAYTAIKQSIESIRSGTFQMPIELESTREEGWERTCDICLMKEMEEKGLGCYDLYLSNECIYFTLNAIMKLDNEQQILFIRHRCDFILQCLVNNEHLS